MYGKVINMTEKKILEQIKMLIDEGKLKDAGSFIEGLSDKERSPRVLCELAGVYNDLSVSEDPDNADTDLLLRSVAILKDIEDLLPENDHLLNYRLGQALICLDRAGEGWERLDRALIERPDDEDTKEIMSKYFGRLTLPLYKKSFKQRIRDGWAKFAAGESKLRRLISEKAESDAITGLCSELLADAFCDPCFEVGFNGEKYDLILSPEKDKLMLFLYEEFKKRAPESVLEHWNILLGRQQVVSENFALGFHGKQIAPTEITVRTERGDNGFKIIGYCEQLAPLLPGQRGEALWFFDILLDMAIGEVVSMRYVDAIDLEAKPFEGIPLPELPKEMEKLFGEKEGWDSAESYLENYSGYEMKPREFAEDEYPTPRFDSFFCVSALPQLVIDYLEGDHYSINKADNDGVAAGFIFFPAYVFEDDENAKRGEKILNFRDELERYIEEKAGDSFAFVGGASGVNNCYLDFLAWDLRDVLDAAAEFFANQSIVPWAFYQSYRSDVSIVGLMRNEED